MDADTLLTKRQAAAYLRASERTFDRHVRPALPRREGTGFHLSDLDRFIHRGMRHRIYFLRAGELPFIKIGWTGSGVEDRVTSLQIGSPLPLVAIGAFYGELHHEAVVHARFEGLRVRPRGEWFRESPELLALAKLTYPPSWVFVTGRLEHRDATLPKRLSAAALLRDASSGEGGTA